MTGTGALVRFHLRHDRLRLALWAAAIVLLVLTTAASTKGLYGTQAELDRAAAASIDNPAALAFNGPAQALDTIGGQVAFQVGAFGLSMVGLMALLLMGRLTRAEEDSGRLELVRSMPVARHAPLVAASAVVSGLSVVVGLLTALTLLALDLPAPGSFALGASFTVLGLVFVALTAVTAQVTENPRVATGAAGAVLGISFVVRAVGDVGDGALSWLSPIGIAQKSRPYAGERWWALGLAVVIALALAALAAALTERRDFGAGLVRPRPGPPAAAARFRSPLALALRLQRGTVGWWSFALLVTGAAYGSLAESIEDFIDDNEALADVLARTGAANITDAYLATSFLILGLIAGGCALQATLRLRSEESALRAEPLLATPVSRLRWAASHLAVAAGGSAVAVAAGGLGTGVVYAAIVGEPSQVPRLVGASLAHVPAVWVLVGLGVLLFGFVPRWSQLAWAGLAVAFVVGMFGQLLDLPSWLAGISPFEHVPAVPAVGADPLPLVVLSLVTVALATAGLVGFRRRDLG